MEHRKPKMKDFLAESLELLMQEKPFGKKIHFDSYVWPAEGLK